METAGTRVWIYCLQGYYLSTPGFFLLDWLTGINLRASYFDHKPVLNILYYALSFGCGILCLAFRRATVLIGLGESVLNIVMLIMSFGLTYVGAIRSAIDDKPELLQQHVDMLQSTGNFMISALVLSVSFYFNPLMRRNPSA